MHRDVASVIEVLTRFRLLGPPLLHYGSPEIRRALPHGAPGQRPLRADGGHAGADGWSEEAGGAGGPGRAGRQEPRPKLPVHRLQSQQAQHLVQSGLVSGGGGQRQAELNNTLLCAGWSGSEVVC